MIYSIVKLAVDMELPLHIILAVLGVLGDKHMKAMLVQCSISFVSPGKLKRNPLTRPDCP